MIIKPETPGALIVDRPASSRSLNRTTQAFSVVLLRLPPTIVAVRVFAGGSAFVTAAPVDASPES
jgi:hypothetical protein